MKGLLLELIMLSCFFVGNNSKSFATPIDSTFVKKNMNVLLIIVDDEDPFMNGLIQQDVSTPAFKKLSKHSFLFTKAFCAVPACAPSRTALLTGMAPYHTGSYYNNQDLWATKSKYAKIATLPKYFKEKGYLTAGYGKIFHTGAMSELTKGDWTKGYFVPYNQPKDMSLKNQVISRTKVFSDMWSFGVLPNSWDQEDTTRMQQDTKNTNRVIKLLSKKHDRPFFIALGIHKPHVPYYSAQRYYNMYPLDSIKVPPRGYLKGDMEDVPEAAQWLAEHREYYKKIKKRGLWKKLIQANMASVTYADDQLSRVLNILRKSNYNNNTVVIFVGDNGWHEGQKDHWSKFTLWDKATRVPMAIRLPGQKTEQKINSPVSLLDIYPTLVDLCGLKMPKHTLDGKSLLSILKRESQKRGTPVLSTQGRNCNAVITSKYYYIHYRNGAEELYDQEADLYQWHNLANDNNYIPIVKKMKKYLPKNQMANLPFTYGNESTKGWDPKVFKEGYIYKK